ncbi:MAG: hypothetical protein ACIAQU_02530, partial [Phycisphaerales bacterium JB064]
MHARTKHRIVTIRMLVVSMAVGVVLAVASVPYGTLVREAAFRGWVMGKWPGSQRAIGLSPSLNVFERDDTWVAWGPFAEADIGLMGSPGKIESKMLPAAARRHALQRDEPFDVFWSGYPWKCAVGWWDLGGDRAWLVQWAHVRHRPIVMPLRPMWPGLLSNTLVYAGCVLVPWTGGRLVRTRR